MLPASFENNLSLQCFQFAVIFFSMSLIHFDCQSCRNLVKPKMFDCLQARSKARVGRPEAEGVEDAGVEASTTKRPVEPSSESRFRCLSLISVPENASLSQIVKI